MPAPVKLSYVRPQCMGYRAALPFVRRARRRATADDLYDGARVLAETLATLADR